MGRSLIRQIAALVQLGRLHFLFGGVLLHGLGVAIAVSSGARLDLSAFIWTQIAITTTQLMTHFANDYFDLEADRANQTPTQWSGGSRVLVENRLPRRAALMAALVLAAMALGANGVLSLVIRPGIGTFLLFFGAQLLAWCYSAPPIRLHSRGLGEATTMFVVTLLTPISGYATQTGRIDLLPLLAVVPLCCLQFAMLLAIEFPDADGDQQVGKKTLVVRLGAANAARLYTALLLTTYLCLPVLVILGLPPPIALAVSATSPLALVLLWRVWHRHWQQVAHWNRFGFLTIVLLMTTTAAELAGFGWLIGSR